ncbi:MAG: ATP-dependent DNA helicase, partial [Deltaproteobacteria bacterium]|nr:ATP-dependent DNA helicase [Deltaproteobacteria bacterium]
KAYLEEALKLLKLSKGRALLLFTSYARMNEVANTLQRLVPWNVLVQSKMPKTDLLNNFKRDINSVLLATLSFWQGIDVPGESLTVVLIDRLPFTRPSLPIHIGRCQAVSESGQNGFMAYSVPEMTLTLRQGLGRLLRTGNDRGVLAIFDNRLIKCHYGKTILKSLPPSPLVKKLSDLQDFMKEL